MGGKKSYEIYERVKKKKLSCSQYFYNIFTINHTWLVIISSKKCDKLIVAMALSNLGEKKKLWAPNCGNAIAEIGE